MDASREGSKSEGEIKSCMQSGQESLTRKDELDAKFDEQNEILSCAD